MLINRPLKIPKWIEIIEVKRNDKLTQTVIGSNLTKLQNRARATLKSKKELFGMGAMVAMLPTLLQRI